MTVIAVCSLKHSPGATTLALALVTAWSAADHDAQTTPVLVEGDPIGGDLAARIGLPLDPGLASMAATSRHPGSTIDLLAHAQPLPSGGAAVLGPTSPTEAEAALACVGHRLPTVLASKDGGVIDCGRWTQRSAAEPIINGADVMLVVIKPDLAGVEHLRSRTSALRDLAADRLAVVLIGRGPYTQREVEDAVGIAPVLSLADDRHGVDAVLGRVGPRAARRSHLVRSARSILDVVMDDKQAVLA